MKKNVYFSVAFVVLAALLFLGKQGTAAKDGAPKLYAPTKTELLALEGLDARQQALNQAALELCESARERLGLPKETRLRWYPQTQQWIVAQEPPAQAPAPVTSETVAPTRSAS